LDHRLRAVDELDQHARVHVAAAGLVHVVLWRRVDFERIVLALPGGDDRIAKAGHEIDELHAGAWLIAGPERVDASQALRFARKISPDGAVRLDIHHDDMLAMLHGHEPDPGADGRPAGRIDDDIDGIAGAHCFRLAGDCDPAVFDDRIDLAARFGR